MKKLVLLLAIVSVSGAVYAENLFQSSNPFPQTSIETMNNIYESKPETIQQEQKKKKKLWFGRNKQAQQELPRDYVIPQAKVINEGVNGSKGVNDGSFYVFK